MMNKSPLVSPEKAGIKTRKSALVALAGFVVALGAAILLIRVTATTGDIQVAEVRDQVQTREAVIAQQNGVIGQVCKAAGNQVVNPAAKDACVRVEQGLPAVPLPPPVSGRPGADGVGVRYTRQVDRCYIEVGLTSGGVSRFGPFCGDPGPSGAPGTPGASGTAGETGQPGATGERGRPGKAGVGIAEVRSSVSDPCSVNVVLTDGTSQRVGPFCGPPFSGFTMAWNDGSRHTCVRDGGTDTAPRYICDSTLPSTTVTTTSGAARRTR